jgi:hypothetical protein
MDQNPTPSVGRAGAWLYRKLDAVTKVKKISIFFYLCALQWRLHDPAVPVVQEFDRSFLDLR